MLKPRKASPAALDNVLLAHYERAVRAPLVRSRPFVMLLDPVSACQLQCPMCPTGLENRGSVADDRERFRQRGLMDTGLFDAIVDELGPWLYFVNLYNWGEPLLHKQLPRFVQRLNDHQVATDIHTNLSLPLREEMLASLLAAGVDRVEASIDGFSQGTYGRYRVRGDFALARDNLVRLAQLRDRMGLQTQLVWNFLVFRYNENEIGEARRFCADHGIEFVRREAAISEAMRVEFLPSYREGEVLEGCFDQRRQTFDPESLAARDAGSSCGWHYFYSVINHDGSVSPCCAPWEDDWDLGQVAAGGTRFADIWNSSAMQVARGDVAGHRLLAELRESGSLGEVRTVADLQRRGGICRGCQYPEGMLDLYTHYANAILDDALQRLPADSREARLIALLRSDRDGFVQAYAAAPAHEAAAGTGLAAGVAG